jgi:hypothetical protein
VREFDDGFEAALDGVKATAAIIEAVERQRTAAMYFGAAVLGGALGPL